MSTKPLLRALTWTLRIAAFLLLFFFAVQNAERVNIQFFQLKGQAPLVLLLLIFFAGGALFGVLACLPRLFRQRRELGAVKKLTGSGSSEVLAVTQPMAIPPIPSP